MADMRELWRHMPRRERGDDGLWRLVCSCGWTSAPSKYREALGYVCGRESDEKESSRIEVF